MMKSLRAALPVILLAIGMVSNSATAATPALTFVSNIDFGDFTVLGSCSNCTITINATTGARTASAGVILRSTNNGARGQYSVVLTGGGSTAYTVAVTPSTRTMSTAGGTMTVQTFTTYKTPVVSKRNIVYIGARLRIPSVGVTAGSYTSTTYTVTTTP